MHLLLPFMFLGIIFQWSLREYAYDSAAIITLYAEVDIPIDRMIVILPYLTIVPTSHEFGHVDKITDPLGRPYTSTFVLYNMKILMSNDMHWSIILPLFCSSPWGLNDSYPAPYLSPPPRKEAGDSQSHTVKTRRKNKPEPTADIPGIDETPDSSKEDIIEEDTAEQNARNTWTEQTDIMLQKMGLPSNTFNIGARTNKPDMLVQVSSAGDATEQVIRDFSKKHTPFRRENVFYIADTQEIWHLLPIVGK